MADKEPTGISGWLSSILQPLVIIAVDRAIEDLRAEIKSDLVDLETKLLGQFTQLPGMVASQVENVALDAEQVAEKVAQRFGDFLNPQGMAQQIEQAILGGLPHFPGIPGFGLVGQQGAHETTAGTPAPPQEDFMERAKEIRKEMESDQGFNKPAPEEQRTAGTTQQPVRKSKAAEIRKRLEERDPKRKDKS